MNKMMLANLATRIFDVPLFITEAKLDVIFHVLGDRLGIDMPADPAMFAAAPAAVPKIETRLVSTDGNRVMDGEAVPGGKTVAVIPVYGSLVHRSGFLDAMSGLRSYESIRRDLHQAMNDKGIDAVALEIASNGGEGHGLFDLTDEIRQASLHGGKPVAAIINEYAFSAGYSLASAASSIYLTRTSMAGSVGVILRHLDRSGKNAADGLKYTTMYRGARKNDFSDSGPLTKEAMAVLDEILDSAYDLFVDTVAVNRNMKPQMVRDTEAGIFEGEKAVAIGFADHVMPFNRAIMDIAAKAAKKPTGGLRMSDQKLGLQHQLEALMKGSSDEENATALAALGYVPQATARAGEEQHGQERYEAGKQAGIEEGRAAARADAVEIVSLCDLAGQPVAMAGKLLSANLSIDQARKELLDARADAAGGKINSTVSATGTGQIAPLVANAQARADETQGRTKPGKITSLAANAQARAAGNK